MRRIQPAILCAVALVLSTFALLLVSVCTLPLSAQDNLSPQNSVREAVGFAVSEPVRDLAKLPRAPRYGFHEGIPVRRIPKPHLGMSVDPVEQNRTINRPTTDYSVGLDFLGVGNGFPGYTDSAAPPDTNLAVGDTQIVQWVNLSFAILDKFSGTVQAGPIDGNLLFTALGGPCANNNDGDIIAQWDNAAHRWLLAQNVFAGPPYYACVAVSQSADALGAYYLYQFSLGNGFPDYPKWGRWNTTWAQTMNNFGPGGSGFQGPEVCLYERTKLLAGGAARQVCFQLASDGDSLLPADIDSVSAPPSTECQFFIGSLGDVDNAHLSLYSACIDWSHISLAFMTGNHNTQLIAVPSFTPSCNGNYGGDCVPQKGITDEVDSLGDRLMYRFAYYNDPVGGKQHWYVNHDVQSTSFSQAAVRWYEFQAPQISIAPLGMTLFQSGTYAPDGTWRWMGSVAADRNNDILVGYSESCGNNCPGGGPTYPSIELAGRTTTTPAGTLEPELSVVAGAGSQPGTGNRWGDYSAMRIDPDGCTFWYTTEYYLVTQAFDWSTQIASAKFAACHNTAYDGYIELCKQSDPDYPVTGTFNFTLTAPFFSGGPYAVPVGTCSAPIEVPSGEITITEAPVIGVAVDNVTAYSYDQYGNYVDQLDSWTPPNLTATVGVAPGGVNLETIATFTNYAAPPGTLKVCKIAGTGVTVGTLFTFNATGIPQFQVPAGPSPGGSCVIAGSFPVNSPITVTETLPGGVYVSSITVEPSNRGGTQTPNSVVVTIGSGVTEVDFTDATVPIGSCNPSSSMSITAANGNNIVAFVPQANWGTGMNGGTGSDGIAVANVEGSYVAGAPYIIHTVPDYIESCASDPTLGQTVCTANGHSNTVYILQGNPPTILTTLPSAGYGQIDFTGGCCSTCGVAVDGVHHKAAIGVGINGDPSMDNCVNRVTTGTPGFQFLSLGSTPAFDPGPPIPSTAGQISEDWLIDPTTMPPRLLSPGEGESFSCVNPPGGLCKPNYEIAKITYPAGAGNTQLQFFENRLDLMSGYPPDSEADSAAEDCSTEIAMAAMEFYGNPSTPFVADVSNPQFVLGSPNTWSSPSAFYSMSGSNLNIGHTTPGPIAIAQGGSHEGVLGQEPGTGNYPANTVTGFKLNPTFSAGAPFSAWITCNIGNIPQDPADSPFKQGADPHTLTAYQSPGGYQFPAGHAIAVLANTAPANYLALVDLDLMLQLPVWPGTHTCKGSPPTGSIGTLPGPGSPNPVVAFVPLR